MKSFSSFRRAFTLIELLIVVAIIAILAAIAVPNFLEAQVRSKVSRTKADMRTMTTAIEAYAVDNNQFPLCNNFSLSGARVSPDEISNPTTNAQFRILERLSTPIAYLTTGLMVDPFTPIGRRSSFSTGAPQGTATLINPGNDANYKIGLFLKYIALNPTTTSGYADVEGLDGPAKAWILISAGPNRYYPNMGSIFTSTDSALISSQFYDTTNGTTSYGYIFRVGGTNVTGAGLYASEFLKQASVK